MKTKLNTLNNEVILVCDKKKDIYFRIAYILNNLRAEWLLLNCLFLTSLSHDLTNLFLIVFIGCVCLSLLCVVINDYFRISFALVEIWFDCIFIEEICSLLG